MAINIFTISGNVGSDLDVRTTANGKHIGSFSMPVKSGWGENEKTSWVTCKILGERAQKLAQHITKGVKLTVTGNFVLEEWEKDGQKHSRACVIVNDFDFGGGNQQQKPQAQRPQQQPAQRQQQEPDFDFDDGNPPF